MSNGEGNGGATVLAGFSLIISLVAVGGVAYLWFLRPDPLGKGLKSYDMTTPASSLKSEWQMEMNGDLKALLEFQRKHPSKELKEKIESFEVKKEATWGEKSILFYSFKQDGKNQYRTQGFEKNAETGFWKPSYVDATEVEKDNKKLADMMRSWQSSGSLEPKS